MCFLIWLKEKGKRKEEKNKNPLGMHVWKKKKNSKCAQKIPKKQQFPFVIKMWVKNGRKVWKYFLKEIKSKTIQIKI